MPYYDVGNLVTVTKTNMIDEMPCGYGTLRTTGVRIRNQVSCRPVQRSPQLQNLTILTVKSPSILNAPPSPQVLSGARENALAQSQSILQSSRGGWKHLEVLKSTGEGYQSVWEVCVWLPDRITFCWCRSWPSVDRVVRQVPSPLSVEDCRSLVLAYCIIVCCTCNSAYSQLNYVLSR